MRIAFISFEYPPDTGIGGIGTYVLKAARRLTDRGHHVEVFAASSERNGSFDDGGIPVHRIRTDRREDFRSAIVEPFKVRHRAIHFDVLESPEYFHEGSAVAAAVLSIPVVVRLHSPSLLLSELEGGFPPADFLLNLRSYWPQLRRLGRAILEGKERPAWHWTNWPHEFAREQDRAECGFAKRADLVASPSLSLLELMKERWHLDPDRLFHSPNPYDAPASLLSIPTETSSGVVSYFGRLETRKGLVLLARALPLVLTAHPQVRFRFVGRNGAAPDSSPDYASYLRNAAGPDADRLEFTGQLSLSETYRYFSLTDVCVFPSIWENFPNVCLEAMAAARGIVASSEGGMAEMLVDGESGLIVNPMDVAKLVSSIGRLLHDPESRAQMGAAARARLLSEYASEKTIVRLEHSYELAIKNRAVHTGAISSSM